MTAHELVNVAIGQPRYEELVGQIRTDPALLAHMWGDAEHRLEERPGKVWTVCAVRSEGRWVPAAWAASIAEDAMLRCGDNYEHPAWRGKGLYAAAYTYRHTTVVAPSALPAVTYLFAQPIALHEADGWYRSGAHGVSTEAGEPHEWWELRRDPGNGE